MVKNLPVNVGDIRDTFLIPGSGRSPGGGDGNPLQYSCLENLMEQRRLVGYSPQGHKELDATAATCHAHIVDNKTSGYRRWSTHHFLTLKKIHFPRFPPNLSLSPAFKGIQILCLRDSENPNVPFAISKVSVSA